MELIFGMFTLLGDTTVAVIFLFLIIKMCINAYKEKLEREEKLKNERGKPNIKDFRLR